MRALSLGATVVIVIALVGSGVVMYTHHQWAEEMKSRAQIALSKAAETLASAKNALNPTPLSMQDLAKSLELGEEYLSEARAAFDHEEHERALHLAETAKKVAEEVMMQAKWRVERNIQTLKEKIREMENFDKLSYSAALLLEETQKAVENAEERCENERYGSAQKFIDTGMAAVREAIKNVEKIKDAERKIESVESLKNAFDQNLEIVSAIEEAMEYLENSWKCPDVEFSNTFADLAGGLSENVLQKMKELSLKEIYEAEEKIILVENTMETSKCYPHSVTVLLDKAKEILSKAKNAYEGEKYGQAFGQAWAAKSLAANALRKLESKLEIIADLRSDIEIAIAEVAVSPLVDTVPPVVRVLVEESTTTTTHGGTVNFYVAAADDLSGIDSIYLHIKDGWGYHRGYICLYRVPEESWGVNRVPEELGGVPYKYQISENVWYVIFPIEKYTAPGIWTIDVSAGDKVNNWGWEGDVAQFTVLASDLILTAEWVEVPSEIETGEKFSAIIRVSNKTNISVEGILIFTYLGDLTIGFDEVNLGPYEHTNLTHSVVLSDVEPGEYVLGITATYNNLTATDELLIQVVPRTSELHQEVDNTQLTSVV